MELKCKMASSILISLGYYKMNQMLIYSNLLYSNLYILRSYTLQLHIVKKGLLQLFRKDLISAMKLPDNEPLVADEYWSISDQWKQEWERGVQVPVNPDSLPGPSVMVISPNHKGMHDFRL